MPAAICGKVLRRGSAKGLHEGAEPADQGVHGVPLTVHCEPQPKRVEVADLVERDKPRARGAEGIAAFAFVPGASALDLEFTLGHVVDDAEPCDMIQRIYFVEIGATFADDDTKLDFPIGFL